MSNGSTVRRALFLAAFNILVVVTLAESVFLLLVHRPGVAAEAPASVRRLAQQIYRHFNRSLIQFDPHCARYDPEVTYTLKPGSCTFANIEFSNTYHVNHLGLRDTERALEAPEIVVIGDSHTMGWGVEQNETLAGFLSVDLRRKVLNAAVSSYGTVRERRLLDRIDASRLRTLIVQYSDNDLPENLAFREHGNQLPITDRARYDEIVRHYASQQSYYPGKYLFRLFLKVSRLEAPEPDQLHMPAVSPADEAALFLNALEHAGRTSLQGVDVLVLAINQELDQPRPFLQALAERVRSDPPAFVKRLTVLNTYQVLKPEDFYVLDDHMRASGHRVLALRIAGLIEDMAH